MNDFAEFLGKMCAELLLIPALGLWGLNMLFPAVFPLTLSAYTAIILVRIFLK